MLNLFNSEFQKVSHDLNNMEIILEKFLKSEEDNELSQDHASKVRSIAKSCRISGKKGSKLDILMCIKTLLVQRTKNSRNCLQNCGVILGVG